MRKPTPVRRYRSLASRRKPGFTLIELLTVIAILGILAAILVPVVGKVRQTARFSTNVSNVRQWTIACTLHMQDWKGFPPYQGPGSMTEADASDVRPFSIGGVLPWFNALPPYIGEKTLKERVEMGAPLPRIGDNSVWVSPFAVSPTGANTWAAWLSYAPAQISNTLEAAPANRYLTNISRVRDPSRTVLFGETANLTQAKRSGVAYPFINSNTTPGALGRFNRNGTDAENGGLQGRAALGFFDGSVRVFTGEQIDAHNASTATRRGENAEGLIWLQDNLARGR
jgi:prepilin-type N-terminal cleavage/methylation domain-containing protein